MISAMRCIFLTLCCLPATWRRVRSPRGAYRMRVALFAAVSIVAVLAGLAPGALAQTPHDTEAALALDATDLSLLGEPDTTSPRATFQSLRENINKACEQLLAAHGARLAGEPGGASEQSTDEIEQRARLHLQQAIATLDLSDVPAVNKEEAGLETVLLLKEILDRLPVPAVDRIPDAATMSAIPAPHQVWTIPHTQIDIVKVLDGPEAGKFLFSPEAVSMVRPYYEKIKSVRERSTAQPDFFEFYTLTGGDLLPPDWYAWIEALPAWTRKPVLDQAVWQWIGLALVLLVPAGLFWGIARLALRYTGPGRAARRRGMARVFLAVLLAGLALGAREVVSGDLNITGWPFAVVNTGLYALVFASSAFAAYCLLGQIAETIISSPGIDPESIDAGLLRLAARLGGIVAAVVIVFFGGTQIGIPLYGVIAGLGVGGLALGLAARPTLENLIGGLMLYADRPVRVGDFCQFQNTLGTVEAIGLRSTRIRALDRTLITVSNAEFSNMPLINWSRRDQTMLKTIIGLRYETTPTQMREILKRIRALLTDNATVDQRNIRVRFHAMGTYAMEIEVRAYLNTTSQDHFLALQEEIFLDMMRIIEDCGSKLALPSTTTYHVLGGQDGPTAMSAALSGVAAAGRAADKAAAKPDDTVRGAA